MYSSCRANVDTPFGPDPMDEHKAILILGGTGEARQLAARLAALGHDVTSSLAGRTAAPRLPAGKVRIGGFGGPEGLAAYLRADGFTLLIDATHPFAAQISANAVTASARAGIPLIRLERPAWMPPIGAEWIEVDTITEAARALPEGARVLLTIGRQEICAFAGRTDCHFIARVIDVPDDVPAGWEIIATRGPFSVAGERELMVARGITHMVSKNSGGDQAAAKLEAAAALGVKVVMMKRPLLPEAETVSTVADLLERLRT